MSARKTEAEPAVATEPLYLLPPDLAEPWPDLNPRRRPRDPQKFAELVASVRDGGVHEPALVHDRREAGDWTGPKDGARYWIVAGEGRWLAAKEVPGAVLPARVRILTRGEALKIALVENLQREDLSPLDEAQGYRALMEEGGLTQRAVAEMLGVSQPHVANRLRLLELPEPILELIDAGILLASHARDSLLPFIGIPEGKRGKLYENAAKALRLRAKQEGDDAIPGDAVRDIVGQIASRMSRPISGGYGRDAPLFKPAAHKTCGCNGPRFKYDSWGQAAVRCFDDDWWKAAQAAAQAAQEEAERKAQEKLATASAEGGAVPVVSREAFDKRYDFRSYYELSDYGASPTLDPAELAGAAFIAVRSSWDNGQPRLCCVDMNAVRKAKRAATKERRRLIEERKAERTARYLEEAAKLDIEPWMIGAILRARPAREQLLDVGRELGFEMGKHGEVDEALGKLPADQVRTLFKVLALRHRDGELGWRDKVEEAVDTLLRKRFGGRAASLRKKLRAQIEDGGAGGGKAGKGKKKGARARRRGKGKGAAEAEPGAEAAAGDGADAEPEPEAECIECGCTDSAACDPPCAWLVVDRAARVGVCSSCAQDREDAIAALGEWAEQMGVELEAVHAA